MKRYRQYCPIARASEILAERWTLLIVRNLVLGASTYSSIAAGVPGIPKALLARRLRELEEAGLVESRPLRARPGHEYHLTRAGRDLERVLVTLGEWGERWIELTPAHADPTAVLWSWSQSYLNVDALPDRRVVVHFRFPEQPRVNRDFWMIFDVDRSEVCRRAPGPEEDLDVEMNALSLAEWHLGRIAWSTVIRSRGARIDGPRNLARALPTWNRKSRFAALHR